jgi:hypothetical protein
MGSFLESAGPDLSVVVDLITPRDYVADRRRWRPVILAGTEWIGSDHAKSFESFGFDADEEREVAGPDWWSVWLRGPSAIEAEAGVSVDAAVCKAAARQWNHVNIPQLAIQTLHQPKGSFRVKIGGCATADHCS